MYSAEHKFSIVFFLRVFIVLCFILCICIPKTVTAEFSSNEQQNNHEGTAIEHGEVLNLPESRIETNSDEQIRSETYMDIYPEDDVVYGYNWLPDTEIKLTYNVDSYVTNQSDENGDVTFSTYPLEVVPGDTFVMTDYTTIRTHIVADLAITDKDWETDIIKGTAEAGSEIHVYASNGTVMDYLSTTTNELGIWQVDFTGVVDILLGSSGYAYQTDAEGNSTFFKWSIPNPYMAVYTDDDVLEGHDWTPDATITVTIEGVQWVGQSDEFGYVLFYISPFDILPGHVVHMTDGIYKKTYTVMNTTVVEVDLLSDFVHGTADPGCNVRVNACSNFNCDSIETTADGLGYWEADFSDSLDLGWDVYLEVITSIDLDYTAITWEVFKIYLPITVH